MQIVSDRGMDLAPEQWTGIEHLIHRVPLLITLSGKTYRGGEDLTANEFYRMLENTDDFPTTSQPSTGDFIDLYRKLAATDPDILSIHISSGLSGTINSAQEAAKQVPEANITLIDSKTLSGAFGWQVEAATRAIQAGWDVQQITDLVERISAAADTIFTLDDLKYLIHGGRISHIKGLLASMLNIKPVIGVEKVHGKYAQRGQARTFKRSAKLLTDLIAKQHEPGSKLRVQVMHARNPEGAAILRERLDQLFDCTWLPTCAIAPVLGAHTGPSLIGCAYAPQSVFEGLPW